MGHTENIRSDLIWN